MAPTKWVGRTRTLHSLLLCVLQCVYSCVNCWIEPAISDEGSLFYSSSFIFTYYYYYYYYISRALYAFLTRRWETARLYAVLPACEEKEPKKKSIYTKTPSSPRMRPQEQCAMLVYVHISDISACSLCKCLYILLKKIITIIIWYSSKWYAAVRHVMYYIYMVFAILDRW